MNDFAPSDHEDKQNNPPKLIEQASHPDPLPEAEAQSPELESHVEETPRYPEVQELMKEAIDISVGVYGPTKVFARHPGTGNIVELERIGLPGYSLLRDLETTNPTIRVGGIRHKSGRMREFNKTGVKTFECIYSESDDEEFMTCYYEQNADDSNNINVIIRKYSNQPGFTRRRDGSRGIRRHRAQMVLQFTCPKDAFTGFFGKVIGVQPEEYTDLWENILADECDRESARPLLLEDIYKYLLPDFTEIQAAGHDLIPNEMDPAQTETYLEWNATQLYGPRPYTRLMIGNDKLITRDPQRGRPTATGEYGLDKKQFGQLLDRRVRGHYRYHNVFDLPDGS